MTETKTVFKPLKIEDKTLYDSFLPDGYVRGCEFTFANLLLWGKPQYCILHSQLLLFVNYNGYLAYPFPLGKGNKKAAIDAIINHAKESGHPCRIIGLDTEAKAWLEEEYPESFRYLFLPDSFDYVYNIDDLADLAGKKYHGKRNHIHRFLDEHPDFYTESISDNNKQAVIDMAKQWYNAKAEENPESDFHREIGALSTAFDCYDNLCMEGLVLYDQGEILAFTMGSKMYGDMFDVHFEKALPGVGGAYTVINREFARYIREKHPEIKYFDREEDMGIEGLRKAKRSYYPHCQIEKYRAELIK